MRYSSHALCIFAKPTGKSREPPKSDYSEQFIIARELVVPSENERKHYLEGNREKNRESHSFPGGTPSSN